MAPARFDAVDALRGSAMVWMTIFHFCFDLSHFGYWVQDFRNDPVWIGQRTMIVSLFLFCAGLGQAIAVHQGQGWDRFGRRWLQIAACALLVSAGSFAMFPRSFIYFGVLHGIAVMLVVVRLTAGWGRWLWPAGAIAIGLPWLAPLTLEAVPALQPERDALWARLEAADLIPLMDHPRGIGLAEFMNFPGVLMQDAGCMARFSVRITPVSSAFSKLKSVIFSVWSGQAG